MRVRVDSVPEHEATGGELLRAGELVVAYPVLRREGELLSRDLDDLGDVFGTCARVHLEDAGTLVGLGGRVDGVDETTLLAYLLE